VRLRHWAFLSLSVIDVALLLLAFYVPDWGYMFFGIFIVVSIFLFGGAAIIVAGHIGERRSYRYLLILFAAGLALLFLGVLLVSYGYDRGSTLMEVGILILIFLGIVCSFLFEMTVHTHAKAP